MLKTSSDPTNPGGAPSAPSERRAGDVLAGKYVLVRSLGVGGMGQVWVARNLATHAEVAAKVLLPERAVVGDALERFRREAQATASLWHRGIVRAFDLVELDREKGSLLMVMELLHGHTLAQRLERAGRLSLTETLQVIVPILSALDHAHRVGVVHRDLKPDNVFLAMDPDGEVIPKLVDFGISKMRHSSTSITARGALIGTPYYMSPEQVRGDAIDGRSDVFAVGILLYECLSGTPPFLGQTLHDVMRAVVEVQPPPLPDLPAGLGPVIERALAKRAEDRYATAAELATAIVDAVPEAAKVLASTRTPPSTPAGPLSMTSVPPAVAHTTPTLGELRPRRSAGTLVALGAVGGCIVALAIGSLRSANDQPPPSASASLALRAPRANKRVAPGHDVVAAAAPVAATPTPLATTHPRTMIPPASPTPPPIAAPEVPAAAAPAPTVVRDPGF
jgi:eukaryotic-like serine/threonine-protein kinase